MQEHPYPEALKNISTDISPAFISGNKNYFPQADMTFDKWHVIKLLYKHVDSLDQKANEFMTYIQLLMNQLSDFYRQRQYENFTAKLTFIADFAHEKLNDNPISKTIKTLFYGIANYANSQFNNGILEGINSKIQAIKRIARGFRYIRTFKKMTVRRSDTFCLSENMLKSNFIKNQKVGLLTTVRVNLRGCALASAMF